MPRKRAGITALDAAEDPGEIASGRRPAHRRVPATDANPALPFPREVADVMAAGRAAWPSFLKAYSPFILACARRLAHDYDERMDIYAHVCARLFADDCRRIKQFKGHGSHGACKFTTWLAVVVQNLGREWIRGKRGRRRLYRRIRALPTTDQLIFRYQFWEGFDVGEIALLLQTGHGMVTSESQVADALSRMRGLLRRDQVWGLVSRDVRHGAVASLDAPTPAGTRACEPADDEPSQLEAVNESRAVDQFRKAIAALPPIERKALYLKYSGGLAARVIAERLNIGNYKQVYEIQARAILRVRQHLLDEGVGLEDFVRDPRLLELVE